MEAVHSARTALFLAKLGAAELRNCPIAGEELSTHESWGPNVLPAVPHRRVATCMYGHPSWWSKCHLMHGDTQRHCGEHVCAQTLGALGVEPPLAASDCLFSALVMTHSLSWATHGWMSLACEARIYQNKPPKARLVQLPAPSTT